MILLADLVAARSRAGSGGAGASSAGGHAHERARARSGSSPSAASTTVSLALEPLGDGGLQQLLRRAPRSPPRATRPASSPRTLSSESSARAVLDQALEEARRARRPRRRRRSAGCRASSAGGRPGVSTRQWTVRSAGRGGAPSRRGRSEDQPVALVLGDLDAARGWGSCWPCPHHAATAAATRSSPAGGERAGGAVRRRSARASRRGRGA